LIFLAHFLHFQNIFKTIKKRLSTIKRKFLGHMVAPVHKNTNAPLILNIRDIIFFCFGQTIYFFDPCARDNFRGQKSLGPLGISLEMAHFAVCPQKKIISRIFKISGALIVILILTLTQPLTHLEGLGAKSQILTSNITKCTIIYNKVL
jgi:hypothetical protein